MSSMGRGGGGNKMARGGGAPKQAWRPSGSSSSSHASPLHPAGFDDASIKQFSQHEHSQTSSSSKKKEDISDHYYKPQEGTDALSNLYNIANDQSPTEYQPEPANKKFEERDPNEVFNSLVQLGK